MVRSSAASRLSCADFVARIFRCPFHTAFSPSSRPPADAIVRFLYADRRPRDNAAPDLRQLAVAHLD